jgi:hypothetical protein
LKLQRTGDLFTGSISEDGQTWQVIGSTMVHMEFPEARLVVTSHDRSQPNTSTFDHVVVASHLLTDTDVGDVGQAGCVCGIGGNGNTTTYLQGGSGADIWGTQDAFNFDYRLLLDDQRVVAKVHDISADAGVSIDPFAKAGVMIRESLDPASPFVILDVRPGGEIEFMARHSPGGETEFISGGTTTIPVMLRLTRNGSSIVGETSLDGTNWNTVGVAAVNFSAAPLAGNVVTSHNRGTITYGSFEEPVLK